MGATLPTPFANARELLTVRDYRRLWIVGACTGFARWLEFLALSIFTFQLTGSPALVAFIAIVRMLPYALLGFVVGAVADFVNRRLLLAASMALALAASAVMVALTLTGAATYAVVVAVSVAAGLFWTTDMPVRRRLLAEAVPADQLPSAVGLDNATSHLTRALGPLVGGLIYQTIGISGVFALTGLLYAISMAISLRLTTPQTPIAPHQKPTLRTLLVPPKELLRNRRFRIVLAVTVVYNLWCFPFISMVPVIAQRDFLLSPAAVGALTACDGIGGTIGALVFGALATRRSLFAYYFWGTMTVLLTTLALSYFLVIGVAIPILLIMGLGAAFFSATQFALVYSMADPELRSRAAGFLSIFIGLSTVGHYMTGLLFDTFTTDVAAKIIAGQGMVAMAILGILWLRTPDPQAP
ncbi:MAG TPA: MFS transporter [Hyphomicrobiaceae bacterium]|nr:MFS transporter [Hyphomicrobiaceae bacterium]